MKTITKVFDILLVEDSPDDVRLIMETLREADITGHLAVAINGEEAIQYLERRHTDSSMRLPNLILLDLNMPKKNGHEVLEYIKEFPALINVPVVVLTVSQAEQDILKALGLRMNYYLNKPATPEKLKSLLTVISELWLED